MIDPAMDGGGLKDSENAPNSFFPKINRTVFWHLGTDMYSPSNQFEICFTDVWKLIKLAEPDTFKKITISLYKFCTFSSKITARRVV